MQFYEKSADPLDADTREYLVALRTGETDPQIMYRSKSAERTPLLHQRVIFEFLTYLKHFFMHGEQGIGKTQATIDPLDHDADKGGLQHVLVVCPNSIKRNWLREIAKTSRHYEGNTWIIPDSKPKRQKMLAEFKPGIYIVNYEKVRSMKAAGDSLADLGWDWVIADEASKLKNRTSKQSIAMWEFADKCSTARRVALTGTPVTKSPLDLFSIFRFVDPEIFGKKYMAFGHRYAEMILRQFPGKKAFWDDQKKFQNMDELTARAYSVGISYRKEECLDLPPKVYVERYVTLPPVVRKVYNNLRDELVAEIELDQGDGITISAVNVLAKLGKLRQITSGFIYEGLGEARQTIELAKNAKMDELIKMLDEIPGQFLVWALFREDIYAITKALKKAKIKTKAIHGGVDMDTRQKYVDDFQEHKFEALVCQTSTCAYGLTLTAACTAIVFSRDANLEHRLQMADRIHRIGQKKSTTIIDLVAEDTVDELDLDLLAGKFKLAELVTRFDIREIFRTKKKKGTA